jgi:hypothetical protein
MLQEYKTQMDGRSDARKVSQNSFNFVESQKADFIYEGIGSVTKQPS